jgi:hypothetical protein
MSFMVGVTIKHRDRIHETLFSFVPNQLVPGAQKLTGENLKLVWAEFSTVSKAVLMMYIYLSMWMHAYIYS